MGLPDHSEALEARLEYQLETSGDIKTFLSTVAEAQDLGEFSGVLGVRQSPDVDDLNHIDGHHLHSDWIAFIQSMHHPPHSAWPLSIEIFTSSARPQLCGPWPCVEWTFTEVY